ncbi:MAG TPA: MBL fold metallo-hydrolase [Miltoncostaeaceae bacterium]|nr:MBL fold metallo-hydrolase [Miltoncostaeaceae bacterium]
MAELVRSYGAAMTVTGSCHLLEAGGARVVVDCGAFQGSRALFALNREPIAIDAPSVGAVLLTHAHLDHSGRLPVLLKQGFRGPIHARPATIELTRHLLLDAAKIQHEDAERDRRHGRRPDPPLFDEADVEAVLARMQPFEYGRPFDAAGLGVVAQPAGHIPGSAVFTVQAGEATVAFSGDVGNARKEVLPDPAPCPDADLVLMEATYGDREHRPYDATIAELADLLRRAQDRGGKILVPSFALERTHEVLYTLAHLERDHDIAPLPVYVDSPLATKVDEVYDRHPEELSDELRLLRSLGKDPFQPKHLRYTRSVDDSRALTASRGPAIVIAGSGMLSGGRILHHLLAGVGDPSTTVLIVGFQPRGGLGRELIDGAERVRIMGKEVRVRAQVATVGGLSAHADRGELLDWIRPAGARARVRLVHGEPRSLEALRDTLTGEGIAASVQPSEVTLPEGHGHREEAGE